jgi:protein ImuA
MINERKALRLQNPQRIHPLLWRANSLARTARPGLPTGFAQLDTLLPGGGWPLGSLIEVLSVQPGTTELALLRPSLSLLQSNQPIALVNPPLQPYIQCFHNWQLGGHRWLWVKPACVTDALWAAEQLLKHNVCAALVCWAHPASSMAVRRLQLAAQRSSTLCLLARPHTVKQTPSAAHLRLLATPCPQGMHVQVLKRAGALCNTVLTLELYPGTSAPASVSGVFRQTHHHGSMDLSLSAQSIAESVASGSKPANAGTQPAGFHA